MAAEEQHRTLKMSPQEIEDKFRNSLEDVLIVAERLAPTCRTVEELMGMLRLGLENDAMLRLLMNRVKR